MNHQNFGNEAVGPNEAIYLYSLWSVTRAMEKVGITEFDMNSSFCYAVFSSITPGVIPLEQPRDLDAEYDEKYGDDTPDEKYEYDDEEVNG